MRIINRRPDRVGLLVLGMLPFFIAAALYLTFSALRLAENPNDKLLPSFMSFGEAITRLAWQCDKVSGEILLWSDTLWSLRRMAMRLVLATLVGLVFGIANGLIPFVRATPTAPPSPTTCRSARASMPSPPLLSRKRLRHVP
jgi:NitT/TauT family transport system permease protein